MSVTVATNLLNDRNQYLNTVRMHPNELQSNNGRLAKSNRLKAIMTKQIPFFIKKGVH